MKRIIVFGLLLLLSSCAHQGKINHTPGHPAEPYVNSFLARMLIKNGYPLTAVKYVIWEKSAVNAMITPNDIMVITTGLLDAVNENREMDVLAFVIAHELAHYKLHHIRNHIALATGISVGLAVANVFVPFVGLADHLINPLATKALSRSQELDADREAIEILRKANWGSPEAIGVKALTWLKNTNGEKSSFVLWATHPPAADRIENIRKITP